MNRADDPAGQTDRPDEPTSGVRVLGQEPRRPVPLQIARAEERERASSAAGGLEPRRGGSRSAFETALAMLRVDFSPRHRHPTAGAWLAAMLVSVAGSLGADAVLVAIGTHVFPSTRGFVHFRFPDYGKLTVIGVVVACAAWPVVSRVSSAPRWLFLRLAVLVTLVLWLPDLYILVKGEPAKAVAVLVVMHLAIAVVTYNALVHIARTRTDTGSPGASLERAGAAQRSTGPLHEVP